MEQIYIEYPKQIELKLIKEDKDNLIFELDSLKFWNSCKIIFGEKKNGANN